jgi:AcrR family transcriptional regulator
MPSTQTPTPRKGPKQARAKATVDAVLEATAQVLLKEGYDGATTNRIAAIAGVSIGTLYQYFPNKEALVAALATRHVDRTLDLLRAHLVPLADASLEEVTHSFVEAMVASYRVQPELMEQLRRYFTNVDDQGYMNKVLAEAEDLVRAFLEMHRARVKVSDPELAAFVLVRSVDSVIQATLLERKRFLRHGALVTDLVRLVLSYLGVVPARSTRSARKHAHN